jgi:hypothetical protein
MQFPADRTYRKIGSSAFEFETKYMKEEQEKRREPDPWLDAIREAVELEDCVTAQSVAEMIEIPLTALDRHKQMRIAACLKA